MQIRCTPSFHLCFTEQNEESMTYYNLDTEFRFGKYKGKTVREVLDLQSSYLNWCVINVDNFIISDSDAAEMKRYNSRFYLSSEAKSAIKRKAAKENRHAVAWEDSNNTYENEWTYSKYRGSYAQDEMGFSDQTIDDAFEGDPDNYWNID